MIVAVADTHTILWYLYADERLSFPARTAIENALQIGNSVVVSTITIVEMVYLIERGRIASESLSRLLSVFDDRNITLDPYPLDLQVARTLSRVDREQIPDMPDRIIAATALYLGVPVISRDGKIKASHITTIW